jgi:hypothetical protein
MKATTLLAACALLVVSIGQAAETTNTTVKTSEK